jgi:hypothetical protein
MGYNEANEIFNFICERFGEDMLPVFLNNEEDYNFSQSSHFLDLNI